jgi:cytochrome P450
VLDGSPEPFATANREKRAALSHFQPHGVLISDAAHREERRPFNGAVLDEYRSVHHLAGQMVPKICEEADALLSRAQQSGLLSWDDFITAWWRIIRRIVLGDAARNDHALTAMLTRLRRDANWAYLKPKRTALRKRFNQRLRDHLDRAEPGSLAHLVGQIQTSDTTMPHQQVPQWLFAFDPTGMATFRTLALLASHPEHEDRVRDEVAGSDLSTPHELPYLRMCVLESLRLWPTTPGILRETTAPTTWDTGTLPAGSTIVVFVPFFHRDDQRLPYADRFAPEIWAHERAADDWPLVPFSAGPAQCAGRNLVLLTTSSLIAILLSRIRLNLRPPLKLDPARRLPATLSPYHLSFQVI